MNDLGNHPQVQAFIRQVCAPVKAIELHSEIKLELVNHLTDIVEARISDHGDEDEAINQAILQMGDPVLIGKQFHQAHRPRMEWSLLGIMIVFIGLGLIAMYGVQSALANKLPATFLFVKSVYTAIGICLMVFFYYFDYRKLKPYSWMMYNLILILLLFTSIYGRGVNGTPWLDLGIIQINFISLAPFLLMISLAGIMTLPKWKSYSFAFKLLILVILPCVLFIMVNSYLYLFQFFMGAMVLAFFSKKSWKEFTWLSLIYSCMIILLIVSGPDHIISRISVFLNPYMDPQGAGYMAIQSIEAIRSAGLWGHGLGSSLHTVPGIQSESTFTYLIYCFGWVFGFLLTAVVVIFISRVARIARQTKDRYGKLLVISILANLTLLFIWNILMSFGILPVGGVELPFIGFGGKNYVMQLASIGIILRVYRSKNMIRNETYLTHV